MNPCPLCQSYDGIEVEENPDGYMPCIYCFFCHIQISDETIKGVMDKWNSLSEQKPITNKQADLNAD